MKSITPKDMIEYIYRGDEVVAHLPNRLRGTPKATRIFWLVIMGMHETANSIKGVELYDGPF